MSVQWVDPHRLASGDLSFAADGATCAIYGSSVTPSAFYVAATDTTWFAWQRQVSSTQKAAEVATFNHTTGLWSGAFTALVFTITDDDHGVPSIARDAGGYVHLFGGGHNSDVYESVTLAPDDPSEWRDRVTTFSGTYGYPRPILIGSVLYLFFRKDNQTLARKKTTSITAGIPVWGADKAVLTFSTSYRFYGGEIVAIGTDLYFPGIRSESVDSARFDVYYFVYDTTDDSVRNAAGSTTVSAASQPISRATADASFQIVNSGTDVTDLPAHCLDSNGDPHVVYPIGSGNPFPLKHLTFSGGIWSSPASVGANIYRVSPQGYIEAIALTELPGGEVALYYPEDGAEAWGRGGNLTRRTRTAGGSWGVDVTILAAGTYAIARPSRVRDAHADARLMFCEIAQTSLDADGGDKRVFAYGDHGFLRRFPVPASAIHLSTLTVAATTGVGEFVATLSADDTDPGETFTWTLVSDTDGKFSVSGRDLLLAASVTSPASHSLRLRVTDSHGLHFEQSFTMTVVATAEDLVDEFAGDVVLVIDGARDGVGADASFANVKLLVQA